MAAAAATTMFPPIRACIFNIDGLLIDSEDKLTLSMNELLGKYGRPPLTGATRARLISVPNSSNGDILHE
jgi:pseudouridine 5'-phosphatase